MKWIVGFSVLIVIGIIAYFNPYEVSWFPKCPFKLLTGLKCSGCGAQRAVHFLFNFEISKAFHENALLVCSIPYLIGGVVVDNVKNKKERIQSFQNLFFGIKAIYIVLIVIIGFWITRNIFQF